MPSFISTAIKFFKNYLLIILFYSVGNLVYLLSMISLYLGNTSLCLGGAIRKVRHFNASSCIELLLLSLFTLLYIKIFLLNSFSIVVFIKNVFKV